MSAPEVTVLLDALTQAEDARDLETARRLRSEILRVRTSAPDGSPEAHLEPLDHALVERIAIDLARQDRHTDALALLAPASDDAHRRGDRRRGAAVDLLAAQSAVALLDLEAAREILTRWIRPGSDIEAALSSAAALDRFPARADWEDDLVGRAYATLAQLWAAQGYLQRAVTALQQLEHLFEGRPVRGISREGLRIRIAGLHLARGGFETFDGLAEVQGASDDPAWRFLRAERLLLSGRLSAAQQLLGKVGPGAPEYLVEEATWLRANILGTLNRLPEATELVNQALSTSSRPSDWRRLNDLLDARRSFTVGLGVMPLPGGRRNPAARPSARPDAYRASENFERRYEEVGAEWTWRANEVLLALHAGDLASADLLRRALGHLAANIESPLIAAKQLLIESLVDHYQGDFEHALEKAEGAHVRLTRLDCPTDALTACQVRLWAIAKLGLSDSDRGRASREDTERVLSIVRERLSPEDQVLAMLNRWSPADGDLAARIARAPLDAHGFWRAWARRFRTRAVVKKVFDQKKWPDAPHEQSNAGDGQRARPQGIDEGVLGAARRQLANRSVRAKAEAAPLLALPAELLPRDAAVVLYVSLPDRLEILFGDRRGFRRLPLRARASRAALWEAVRVATGLLHRDGGRWTDVAATPEVSKLTALLGIDELAREAGPKVKRLFVIPDDAVVHVPFGALPLNGKPLACRFAPMFLPRPSWALPPAAMATPALAVGLDIKTEAGDPLPNVPRELEELAKANPGVHVLRGHGATREAVLGALGTATSVHFATHGRFDAQQPHETALAVADNWITVEDVQRCGSPALRLAFLGACWGANTFVLPGRELISLPVALLDGGAHEVVASLWPVFDEPSVGFAGSFYRAYRRSGDASRSVAFVQRRWWRNRPAADWAPYVAYARGIAPRRAGRAILWAWWALRRCAAAVRGSP